MKFLERKVKKKERNTLFGSCDVVPQVIQQSAATHLLQIQNRFTFTEQRKQIPRTPGVEREITLVVSRAAAMATPALTLTDK